MKFHRHLPSLAAGIAFTALALFSPVLGPSVAAQTSGTCQFVLGFGQLRDELGTDTVGTCTERQTFADNGDAIQHTTKGLFVWRKSDNHTVFTDGYRTWLQGPRGAEERLNDQTFAWEIRRGRSPGQAQTWWPGSSETAPSPLAAVPVTAWSLAGQPEVGAVLHNISATFGATRKCFDGLTSIVCAFAAGDAYDSVYARDMSSIVPMAQYLYDDATLASAVEETLFLQYDERPLPDEVNTVVPTPPWPAFPGNGAVSGVVDYDARRAKALVTSDEETSLIHSAYVYYHVTGGAPWLASTIRGQTVLERLNAAMGWLYTQRFDAGSGLIKRPHTTDWGDVEMGEADGRTGDTAPTAWTGSIYDQAWTYRALDELAEMNTAAGDAATAGLMLSRGAALKDASHRLLWQADRGYYRTHIHLTPLQHSFDEDAMVSIANAVAAYTGLADNTQVGPIFQALEQTRLRAGVMTPGLSIYPPYPAGTFRSDMMGEGRYQNGGVWDWWGGMQVTAEFERGNAELALSHLSALARDWLEHSNNIFEWKIGPTRPPDPPGRPRPNQGEPAPPPPPLAQPKGSGHYAAAAGSIGEAVVKGLYGLDLAQDRFAVTPRLGARSGWAHLFQPTTGRFLGVEQRYGDGALDVSFATNHPGTGRLAVRLPGSTAPTAATLDGEDVLARLTLTTIGQDTYASLSVVPGGTHQLHLAW